MSNVKKAQAQLENLNSQVGFVLALDHGGRAGSNFFQCLFDNHEEVLACPLVHYTYSYWRRCFGDQIKVTGADAFDFIAKTSYFRLLYNDPQGDIGALITKIGGDVNAPFDRDLFRTLIRATFVEGQTYSRYEVITKAYAAYGVVRGRDLTRVKWLLCIDAVSRYDENVFDGYQVANVDDVQADFEKSVILCLLRDPRAQFASTRHQMLNAQGNNYNLNPTSWFSEFYNLQSDKVVLGEGAAQFALMYQVSTFRSLMRKWQSNQGCWLFLRNEDFNTNFLPTMKSLCQELTVSPDPQWVEKGDDYAVSMIGAPWAGTGAYHNRYQNNKHGPLRNENDVVSAKMVKPNKHVTTRWRSKLPENEQVLLRYWFAEELEACGYEDVTSSLPHVPMVEYLYPFAGELPTIDWLREGWRLSLEEGAERVFYAMSFGPFYLLSRFKLRKYENEGFFKGTFPEGKKGTKLPLVGV